MDGQPWFAVAVGVARKVNPRSRMVRTDSDSRKNRRPDCVVQGFQVSADAIEPIAGLGHLLAQEIAMAPVSDETPELGPHISRNRSPSRRAREALARTRAGPAGSIIWPSSEPKGIGPSTNTGEEMTLPEPSEVSRWHVLDVSFIDFPIGNQSVSDEFAQPRGGERIVLVVVARHLRRDAHLVGAPGTPLDITRSKSSSL
jgi:hypothetical protein